MNKKRFNTNIQEEKLLLLKKIALENSIGANDTIEMFVDMYLEQQTRAKHVSEISFNNKLKQILIDELREKDLVLENYKILLEQKWISNYKKHSEKRHNRLLEEYTEIFIEDTDNQKNYFIQFTYFETEEKEIEIECVNYNIIEKEKERFIESLEIILEEKISEDELDKIIRIDNAVMKCSKVKNFEHYSTERTIFYNV